MATEMNDDNETDTVIEIDSMIQQQQQTYGDGGGGGGKEDDIILDVDIEEDEEETLENFANICVESPSNPKRGICDRCERPQTVCYCSMITPTPLAIRNHLIVLQHPNEVKRCLRTTKIIELSIPSENYHLFRGKRFHERKYSQLYRLLLGDANDHDDHDHDHDDQLDQHHNKRETVLLFPSDDAQPLSTLPTDRTYNIVILDGTWSQAKTLYNTNTVVQQLRCIKLDNTEPSRYVIRTQPTQTCLSTVEAAGLVLAHLESPSLQIMNWFTRPLKAICDFQLNKGAVEHQSKEYLITNGLYQKPLNKRLQKQLDLNHKLDFKDLLC